MFKSLLSIITILPIMAYASGPFEFYDQGKPGYEFTNFFEAPFDESGPGYNNRWKTSEHYFQAKKFNSPNTRTILDQIKNSNTPREAFTIGQNNPTLVRAGWHPTTGSDDRNCIKVNVMFDAQNRKYDAHPALKALLIATNGLGIFECSPIDPYWGT